MMTSGDLQQKFINSADVSAPDSDRCVASSATSSKSASLDKFVIQNEVLVAEILWTMKCIKAHYSYVSCEDIGNLFRRMFPDSEIVKHFKLGEKKCAYLCQFGLAPYFRGIMLNTLKTVPHFVLLFDETLNQTTQSKQMDVHVRYWHSNNIVRTQYLMSVFMGHSTCEDMLSSFYEATRELDLSKILQLSMDGPNVNWKFYGCLQEHLAKEYNIQCICIGSCGLHIFNNSFRYGFQAINWNIPSLLSALYWLFKDSPAKHEDYLQVSKTKKSPVKFCSYRWLENLPAVERAIEIWPDIIAYVEKVKSGKFGKVSCKSFTIILEATKDPLILVKMNFFACVAKLIKPFLEIYQSERPLLPFLAKDILAVVQQILELFNVLNCPEEISTVNSLCNFNFSDATKYSLKDKVSLGFVADTLLKGKSRRNEITDADRLNVKNEGQKCIIKLLTHLMDKCAINYSLTRNVACLDPTMMANNPSKSRQQMKMLLTYLVNKKQLRSEKCDEILLEYADFLETIVKPYFGEFKNFNHKADPLDVFLSSHFQGRHSNLWEVVKMLLIISHGQACVERGFSINKKIEVENLQEQSYVAHRVVCDSIKIAGGLANVEITKDMLVSASAARKKYGMYLEEQKSEKLKQKKKQKLA